METTTAPRAMRTNDPEDDDGETTGERTNGVM